TETVTEEAELVSEEDAASLQCVQVEERISGLLLLNWLVGAVLNCEGLKVENQNKDGSIKKQRYTCAGQRIRISLKCLL
ncbi:hypothetical protein XENOCAPTIV_019265, partial [Xenoophorus captivus]